LSAPVAVAATGAFGADVLERLASEHEITALLTRPDAPAGRGRKLQAAPAKETAGRLGIPVLEPERLAPGIELGAPIVVAVSYGLIVPEDVLAERLWLNVHPSLLPRWRGAAPVERAVMAGDVETGVSIIKLVKELDAGPIAAQALLPIGADDDAGAIYDKASEVAERLLADVLDDPGPTFREQVGEPTYAAKIDAGARALDLERPAQELVNVVRALSPHIGARAELHGRGVTIWRARVDGGGAFEPVEVQPDGGRRMPYDAWLRGIRQ
jgi:methionyl-tRNA formyltransferase